MFGPSVLLALLAFLCAAQAKETEEARILREIYTLKCKKAHPELRDHEVAVHDMAFYCVYYCAGFDNKNIQQAYLLNKDDDLKCTGNLGFKEPSYCSNGTCVFSSSIDLCKGKVMGELKAVVAKECALTCHDEQGNAFQAYKPEGGSCKSEVQPGRPATCTSYRYCEAVTTYIEDSKDADGTNDQIAQTECSRKHKNVVLFSANRETCEYVCAFNETGDWDHEYFSLQNGRPCGDSNTCLAGGCRKPSDIRKCKKVLGGDVLERIDFYECKKICVGKNHKESLNMPEDATCKKRLQGWYPAEGSCDDDGECMIDEEKYKDFFNR